MERAELLAQPDEVLLRVLTQLPMPEQRALALTHPRFARLFNDPTAWQRRLEAHYPMPPTQRATLAATVARALAPNDPRRSRAARHAGFRADSAKRQYEYLARNERAALRFPEGYERVDAQTRAAAVAPSGLVALRLLAPAAAAAGPAGGARVALELGRPAIALMDDATATAAPQPRPPLVWRRLLAGTVDALGIHFCGLSPDGAQALVALTNMVSIERLGVLHSARLEFVPTHVPAAEAGHARGAARHRFVVSDVAYERWQALRAEAVADAADAGEPFYGLECYSRVVGTAWGGGGNADTTWFVICYRHAYRLLDAEARPRDTLAYGTDMLVLMRDGSDPLDPLSVTAGWRNIGRGPVEPLLVRDEADAFELVGALGARQLVGTRDQRYVLIDIDAVAGTVHERAHTPVLEAERFRERQRVVVGVWPPQQNNGGVVAALDSWGPTLRATVDYLDLEGDGDGETELLTPPPTADVTEGWRARLDSVVAGRLLVRLGAWRGLFFRAHADAAWRCVDEAVLPLASLTHLTEATAALERARHALEDITNALAYSSDRIGGAGDEAREHALRLTELAAAEAEMARWQAIRERTDVADALLMLTSDMAYAVTAAPHLGLWRVAATAGALVSAELGEGGGGGGGGAAGVAVD